MSGPIDDRGPAAEPGVAHPRAGDSQRALLAVVFALVSIGIIMIWSTSSIEALRPRGRYFGDPTYFLRRQVLWLVLAVIGLALTWATDFRLLLRRRGLLVAAVATALVAVLFTAKVNNAHRWFDLGGAHLQPSELAKLAAIFFLAGHASRRDETGRYRIETLRGALEGFLVLGLLVVLVLKEPDLGTAALIGISGTVLLLVAGARLAHLALMAGPAAALGGLYALWHIDRELAHVKTRLFVFMNPDADLHGTGYQIHQTLIALGSGGPLGLGLGASRQKLFFLPEDYTDFILAILGEELGLLGTLATAALFAAFVFHGLKIAIHARDREGSLIALGVTMVVGLQAAMNIAVVTASMPTKGISLPFVSYGGSSLLVAMAGVGLLLNVAAQQREAVADAGL